MNEQVKKAVMGKACRMHESLGMLRGFAGKSERNKPYLNP
jgi:hypothetical protein